jgi:hypothetical protein
MKDFLISDMPIVGHKNYWGEDRCSVSFLLTKWGICRNTAYQTQTCAVKLKTSNQYNKS